MDYSQGSTVTGNTDLTAAVVASYYANMPKSIGFINGYTPSFTFAEDAASEVPLLSFDYYLDPDVTTAGAVLDLQQLAAVNAARPYFLLMHIREFGDIGRVSGVARGAVSM